MADDQQNNEHLHGLTNLRMQQMICNVHDLSPHIKQISIFPYKIYFKDETLLKKFL